MNRTVLLLFVLGFSLRLLFIDSHAFWFDEAASVSIASQPIQHLLKTVAADTHPPLFFMVLKVWSLFSNDYLYLRLFSVIVGSLTLLLSYALAKHFASPQASLLSMAMMVFSPLHIYYSTEIRMYALAVCVSTIAFLFFAKTIKREKSIYWLILLASLTVGMYLHYYMGLVTLSLLAVTWFYKKSKVKKMALITLLSFLMFTPWLMYTVGYPKPDCWCFSPFVGIPLFILSLGLGGLGLVTLKDYLLHLSPPSLFVMSIPAVHISIFFIFGTWSMYIQKKRTWITIILVPILFISLIGIIFPYFSPRSLIIFMPIFLTLSAIGYTSLKPAFLSRLFLLLTFVGLFFLLVNMYIDPFFKLPVSEKQYLAFLTSLWI